LANADTPLNIRHSNYYKATSYSGETLWRRTKRSDEKRWGWRLVKVKEGKQRLEGGMKVMLVPLVSLENPWSCTAARKYYYFLNWWG
jgi:hypothetical protein